MAKQKPTTKEQAEKCGDCIFRELALWKHYRDVGGRDPFFTDGENMNLIRNHVISYKLEIEQLCPKGDYPDEYYLPTPDEVDTNYMAKEGKYCKQRTERIEAAHNCRKMTNRKPADISDEQVLFGGDV